MTKRIASQTARLRRYLESGKKIHVFHPAKVRLKIGYLNSRASDLKNKHHVPIHKKWIVARDSNGEWVPCVEYSIKKKVG